MKTCSSVKHVLPYSTHHWSNRLVTLNKDTRIHHGPTDNWPAINRDLEVHWCRFCTPNDLDHLVCFLALWDLFFFCSSQSPPYQWTRRYPMRAILAVNHVWPWLRVIRARTRRSAIERGWQCLTFTLWPASVRSLRAVRCELHCIRMQHL